MCHPNSSNPISDINQNKRIKRKTELRNKNSFKKQLIKLLKEYLLIIEKKNSSESIILKIRQTCFFKT